MVFLKCFYSIGIIKLLLLNFISFRYISIFYYCRKIKESKQKLDDGSIRRYYRQIIQHEVELRHVSFLSCMESGPQMYLQWYIVGYYDDATISDTIKCTFNDFFLVLRYIFIIFNYS